MKVGKVCALLSALQMCFPLSGTSVSAAEPTSAPVQQRAAAPARLSMDVVASATGELRGAVVNRDSAPSANARVVLRTVNGQDSREATTDASGRFLFTNVRAGMYTLAVNGTSGQAQSIARVWTPETAPPAASSVALVSLQNAQTGDVVRGEDSCANGNCGGGGYDDGGLFGGGAGGLLLGAAIVGGAVVGIVAIAGGFNGGGGGGGGNQNPQSAP